MKIGIMSFAHLHAESYIGNIRAVPGVEMIGIADEDLSRGKHFSQMFNARLFASYESLLAEKPDGVVVCSENARHRRLVEMAANAGVHILCEKPLATTVEDAQAMLDICETNGVKLMTAFPMRFSTPIVEIKRMIDGGGLGQIYAVNGTNQGECPKHLRSWFVDKQLAGGGALMDHIVHLADILRWYLGSEVTEVFADANHILYASETEVETGGLVSLKFANGTIATIDCSWNKPPYYPTWGGLALDLISEKGLVNVNAFKQVMTVYTHAAQRPRYAYWGSDADQGLINDFVAAIREDRAPAVTGYDGYKAVEIVAAAYRSVESGQPVALK
ncbi:MAG: Gfo/Idh/MocA family oxidoreductase [Anaerolineae bacterium]